MSQPPMQDDQVESADIVMQNPERRDLIWAFEVYEREENVFIAGSWVSFLHITATGTYSYIEGGVSMSPIG